MKLPKAKRRYCKYCKRHTEHKVLQVKGRERGSLKKGSIARLMKRGRGRAGFGNKGRFSRPPKPKRVGAKISKKTNLKFVCNECKKTTVQRFGIRAKRIIFE